jgi:peroxiredoxin
MSEEDKNTPVGYLITAKLFPPAVVNVGDDMADADLLDTDGNTKHLSDYLGKYLLLDFWIRGCGPCIMALPEMKEISETYRDKLTIISISLDGENAWKGALSAHDMPWVNICDPKSMGGVAANYGVTGIPNYVMISPEGKIIDKWMGFGEGFLREKVSANLK